MKYLLLLLLTSCSTLAPIAGGAIGGAAGSLGGPATAAIGGAVGVTAASMKPKALYGIWVGCTY